MPDCDYYWLWGGAIEKVGGLYVLIFSAQAVAKGAGQPTPADPAGYVAFARDDSLEFGAPREIWFPEGAGAPHTWTAVNQRLAIRIDDSMYYDDANQRWWLSYVWFNWDGGIADDNRGNWIASCAMDNPTAVVTNTWPVAGESHVTEGAEFFRRGSNYFVFFSVNGWAGAYGMKYRKHTSMANLQRNLVTPSWLFSAVNDPNDPASGYQVDAAGAPGMVQVNGETYLYCHVLRHENGVCGDPDSPIERCRRDTVVSKILFDGNNSPYRLNGVNITWNAAGDPAVTSYSLDIQLMDDSWVGPCIHAGVLGNTLQYRYNGACADHSGNPATPEELLYPKGEIKRFRLVAATNGDWANAVFWDAVYDGYSNSVNFGN